MHSWPSRWGPDARLPAAYCGLCPCSEGVGGTAHGNARSLEDMGLNHRRRNRFVSQQLRLRSDIIAAFQEVGRNSNVCKVDGFAIDVRLTTFFTTRCNRVV